MSEVKAVDWSQVPVMEDVPQFVAGGKVWAVKEITLISEINEWEEVTIVGVRPSHKVEGVYELVEVRGAAPRRGLGKDLTYGAPDWQWPQREAVTNAEKTDDGQSTETP